MLGNSISTLLSAKLKIIHFDSVTENQLCFSRNILLLSSVNGQIRPSMGLCRTEEWMCRYVSVVHTSEAMYLILYFKCDKCFGRKPFCLLKSKYIRKTTIQK